MNRVLLLNLPFYTIQCPSIGLGLLKAALLRDGIPCDTSYLNLHFSAALRNAIPEQDEPCEFIRRRFSLLGEWIFRDALFGKAEDCRIESLRGFLNDYVGYLARPKGAPPVDLTKLIHVVLRAREAAEPFLDECMARIDWAKYSIVGFSLMFSQTLPSLALARRIKAAYPNKIIVLGGAACEERMGETLHRLFPFVDAVFSGEADYTFPKYVRQKMRGETPAGIPNIVYRSGAQTCSTVRQSCPQADLEQLPLPDYDDYFREWDATQGDSRLRPFLIFETSRGCWWGEKSHCTFCSLNGTSIAYRSKSPGRALQEIMDLYLRYGIRQMEAVDNIFPLQYFSSLLPELKRRKLRLQLGFETKANLTRERVRLLWDAGVCKLSPGIESLSTGVLRAMRKGCTSLQNIQLLKWAREVGMELEWNMLIGVPGEDPADYPVMADVIRAIPHLQPPWGCTFIRLDRFSPYFTDPGRFGLCNIHPLDVYKYIYPFEEKDLADLVYYFRYDFADGRDTRSYTQCVVDAVEEWKAYEGASLTWAADGRYLHVRDNRPKFPAQQVVLTGVERDVFDFCDEARPRRAIMAHVNGAAGVRPARAPGSTVHADRFTAGGTVLIEESPRHTADEAGVMAFLDRMVRLRFMLREGDTYLSLATQRTGGL